MTSSPSMTDLENSLDQARVTIDYLIADVVRLKDELGEAREELRKLKEAQQHKTPTIEEIVTKHFTANS